LLKLRGRPLAECGALLRRLAGVGPKVADCVCLMALEQHGAVPVDRHVLRLTARHYLPDLAQRKSLSAAVREQISAPGWLFAALNTSLRCRQLLPRHLRPHGGLGPGGLVRAAAQIVISLEILLIRNEYVR